MTLSHAGGAESTRGPPATRSRRGSLSSQQARLWCH
jgi:hypothetical protein